MPRPAVLPSPAERRDREQAAPLHPGEPLRLEARPDRDVEATVAIQERWDVASRGGVAVPGQEQRDAGSIVRRHEDLLADEVARIPGQRASTDLADGAIGHANGKDHGRRDERREGQEQLIVAAVPGHLDDRADPGQANVGDVTAIELEQRQPAMGVVEVRRRQPIADEANVLERLIVSAMTSRGWVGSSTSTAMTRPSGASRSVSR